MTATATRPSDRRGTSNGNAAGSAAQRRARKVWLIETYRADVDLDADTVVLLLMDPYPAARFSDSASKPFGEGIPACRCYRCGMLLEFNTVTVDRIKPGCKGGTYARTNIRPACSPCNTATGARLGVEQRAAKRAASNGRRRSPGRTKLAEGKEARP
jgi:hypothetical protein